MVNIENVERKFINMIESNEFKKLQEYFNDSSELIYKSRNIILNLLNKRGFNTADYEGFSVNEVHIMNNNKQLDLLLEHEDTDKKIYVSTRNSFN